MINNSDKTVKLCNDDSLKDYTSKFNSGNREEGLPIPRSCMAEVFVGSCSRGLNLTDAEIQSVIDKADED